jgi:hypothetical protein
MDPRTLESLKLFQGRQDENPMLERSRRFYLGKS